MMIHVLIVEDDDDFIEEIQEILFALPGQKKIKIAHSRDEAYSLLEDFIEEIQEILFALPGQKKIKIAHSRDEAYSLLEDGFLDLVILDLKIPTVSGALDANPEHGHVVFNKIRSEAPGTPIFVLTGSPVEDFIPSLLQNQQQIDIWSEGKKTGTIEFLKKYKINTCPEILIPIANAIERLSDVELDHEGLDLSLAEDRLLRIFAKKFQGARCVVSKLGGGLSGARVIRLYVTDSQGVQVHNAVAKLAKLDAILREGQCFDDHVARLRPEATPRKLATLEFGAHNLAGIFFSLQAGFDNSVFEVARHYPNRCSTIIKSVESTTKPWVSGVPETRKTIREFRRRILSDQSFEEIQAAFGLDWVSDFEGKEIQARWACIHGDLHGCNILVSAKNTTALIDYGNVGNGPASLDPVTLELSVLFHPEAVVPAGAWPSGEQAKAWGNLDSYLVDCPFPEFTQECRQWAFRVATGKRDVAASAYSYLIRQLKYDDTNKELAICLLEGVKSFYDQST